ncbi:aminotransferase [Marispirochaeta aestuarii]|uniref:Aminotransferase n=1 Tax=Marispirochaeta aestuarii TaxID=1963862 RepID=A0A1Y1RX35_9SPIO|nr:aminotransferase class I/II-fold pyridoxal phosphate-dependent enzyme [Marispirochaeta aestuarii]ORC34878.1 aminotransferase [Marispirochaeta aestuarii]
MNPLAQELNRILDGSVCLDLLSDFGKRFYFPRGIALQSVEASEHAHRFNATVGMAYSEGHPIELETIREHMPLLSPAEAVAYAPSPGLPALRKLWREEIYRKNPSLNKREISLPVVVPGLTSGITQIADLFAGEGDTVLVPDMFWGNYRLIFEVRNGSVIKTFPFFTDEGKLNIQAFVNAMRSSAKNGKIILLVNFPNNPSGYSPTNEEAHTLASAVREVAEEGYKILVVTDDAYFGLFYEEDTFKESFFALAANCHENVLAAKVDGPTKEDFCWGFRVGFLTFASPSMTMEQYDALNKKVGGALRGSISNSSRPGQSILLKTLEKLDHDEEKKKWMEVLKERYLKVKEILETRSTGRELTPMPFNSGYFMSFNCGSVDAEKLRLELLHKEGIGTISIGSDCLRVAFSSIDTKDLQPLFDAIFAAADRLAG